MADSERDPAPTTGPGETKEQGDVGGAAPGEAGAVEGVVAAVGEAAGQVKDKVQEWATTAADKTGGAAGDVGRGLTDLIRRHPLPALLVGFGLGLLLARTMRT